MFQLTIWPSRDFDYKPKSTMLSAKPKIRSWNKTKNRESDDLEACINPSNRQDHLNPVIYFLEAEASKFRVNVNFTKLKRRTEQGKRNRTLASPPANFPATSDLCE